MYELIQTGSRSFYIQSPAKIGIFKRDDSNVCLIDSGSDKEAGKKILKILKANQWNLTAIYNTHSNADHIGGNKYLQDQTGCKIYAPGIECAFTNTPILEPAFLYGGFPPKDLRRKFILAQESAAEPLTPESLPDGLSAISLPGHFFDMVGFRTSDDVVYLADCLSGKETLDKYQIGFLYDVEAYLSTLKQVMEMKAALFVPSHAEPASDITALAQYNIDKVMEIASQITDFCREPICFEQLLQKLFYHYELTMTFEQYALVGSTVRSYLSWLKKEGRLDTLIENNMLLWKTIPPL